MAFDEWVVDHEVPESTRLATTIDRWQAEVRVLRHARHERRQLRDTDPAPRGPIP